MLKSDGMLICLDTLNHNVADGRRDGQTVKSHINTARYYADAQ